MIFRLASAFAILTAVLASAFPAFAQDKGAREPPLWVMVCEKPGDPKADPAKAEATAPGQQSACVIRQRLVAGADKKQVLLVGLLPKPDGAVMRLVLPLGLDLSKAVHGDVDGKALGDVPVGTCVPGGCIAVAALDADKVAALKAGTKLTVTFAGSTGQTFAVTVLLAGFSKAFDEASKKNATP